MEGGVGLGGEGFLVVDPGFWAANERKILEDFFNSGKKVLKFISTDKTHAFDIRCLTHFDSNFFGMILMAMFALVGFFVFGLGFSSGFI